MNVHDFGGFGHDPFGGVGGPGDDGLDDPTLTSFEQEVEVDLSYAERGADGALEGYGSLSVDGEVRSFAGADGELRLAGGFEIARTDADLVGGEIASVDQVETRLEFVQIDEDTAVVRVRETGEGFDHVRDDDASDGVTGYASTGYDYSREATFSIDGVENIEALARGELPPEVGEVFHGDLPQGVDELTGRPERPGPSGGDDHPAHLVRDGLFGGDRFDPYGQQAPYERPDRYGEADRSGPHGPHGPHGPYEQRGR